MAISKFPVGTVTRTSYLCNKEAALLFPIARRVASLFISHQLESTLLSCFLGINHIFHRYRPIKNFTWIIGDITASAGACLIIYASKVHLFALSRLSKTRLSYVGLFVQAFWIGYFIWQIYVCFFKKTISASTTIASSLTTDASNTKANRGQTTTNTDPQSENISIVSNELPRPPSDSYTSSPLHISSYEGSGSTTTCNSPPPSSCGSTSMLSSSSNSPQSALASSTTGSSPFSTFKVPSGGIVNDAGRRRRNNRPKPMMTAQKVSDGTAVQHDDKDLPEGSDKMADKHKDKDLSEASGGTVIEYASSLTLQAKTLHNTIEESISQFNENASISKLKQSLEEQYITYKNLGAALTEVARKRSDHSSISSEENYTYTVVAPELLRCQGLLWKVQSKLRDNGVDVELDTDFTTTAKKLSFKKHESNNNCSVQ